jgi:hypothetical protein
VTHHNGCAEMAFCFLAPCSVCCVCPLLGTAASVRGGSKPNWAAERGRLTAECNYATKIPDKMFGIFFEVSNLLRIC